ncbi:hypothetical protein [Brevibacillus brevis]|uniref:hypothetical protein n=1 Tax=Brevibacillus brevis TaxID=1393 RepID=UPI000D106482|nr:hypothetical protein [Brevibacillus brevis]PSJ66056.1 hypothetical protein C7J99_27190 [Brevibacillus brevis]GEC91086.1 hypothetical protein BBR01nite_34170 [Brevibacillus brevis]
MTFCPGLSDHYFYLLAQLLVLIAYLLGDGLDLRSDLLANRRPSVYHVEDTWENYDHIKEWIDNEYEYWCEKNE